MANFISRNILICVVPAVIALLSVYWFRKKKKMKSGIFPALPKESFIDSKDGLHSHKNMLISPIECSSDFANTLSDASSIASPENSSQSYVSSTEDVSDSVESDNVSNCVDYVSSTCNSSLDKISMSSVSAVSVSLSNKNFESNDNTLVSGVEFSFPITQNKIEFDKNSSKQSTASEKLSFPNDIIEDIQVENKICRKLESSSSFECNNHISHSHEDSLQEMVDNASKTDLCLNIKQSSEDNKDVSYQSSNLDDCISFPNGEPKFSALTEVDSNDSHSSVLDENSLSISDESESRQVIDFKNKDSPSSVLDENSFCDESERTDISGNGTILHFKMGESNETDAAKNVSPKLEELSDSCLNVPLLNKSNSVKQFRNFTCSDVKAEMIAADNVKADVDKNFELAVSLTEEVNELNILKPSNKSASDLLQTNSIASVYTVNSNLDFPTIDDEKLPSVSDIVKDDVDAVESGKSIESVIHLCDNSESVCVHLSNENSGLDIASSIKETVTDDSTVISDRDTDNLNNSLVKEHKNGDSGICSSADESLSSKDAEISEMNISSYFNIRVPSDVRTKVNIPETNQGKTEDCQHMVNQNSIDSELMDMKVPGDSSSHFVYEFDLPQELCGRLIGKQGKHVKSIKERTNANVFIKRHPYDSQLKTVVVEGNRSDVKDALGIIRKKYPILQFPTVTLEQTNLISSHAMSLPDSLQLHLPDGVSCDVILSSLVSAGHFFLQQPTHPTYPSLSTLDQCMMNCYSQMDTPLLPHPVEAGVICAAPVLRGWYRAQVIYVFENGTECEIKFVDYGGFSQVPTSSLRQIRSDFMTLPFQATECYLANVKPIDRSGWSADATATFEELAQGQILQAYLVDIADDGIPCVHLYKVQGISNMFINRELVERGFAVWVDNGHWDPH